ncbi:MAG TPA: hypothetical protein VFQ23_00490 [Anaerolineales bacterium]|nr:hypothetical protein [Anaerolineales bacterium]
MEIFTSLVAGMLAGGSYGAVTGRAIEQIIRLPSAGHLSKSNKIKIECTARALIVRFVGGIQGYN